MIFTEGASASGPLRNVVGEPSRTKNFHYTGLMIRHYAEPDCEAIVEIWAAASRLATPFLTDGFLEQESRNIRNVWFDEAETWVFDTDDIITGFLSLIENEVGALFVHPRSQRRGIGRALMDHAASLHKHLFLDVFTRNTTGRRFYEQYGCRFEYEHLHAQTGEMLMRLTYRG